MKFILALALLICLLGCKEKEPIVSGPPYGLVGTYEITSTKPAPVFQELLSGYTDFNQVTTLIISQMGTDTYRLELKVTGIAKKGKTDSFTYGFTADMTGSKTNQLNEFKFKGKYSNLIPFNAPLDKSNKDIDVELITRGISLDVSAGIYGEEGVYLIVDNTLTKTK